MIIVLKDGRQIKRNFYRFTVSLGALLARGPLGLKVKWVRLTARVPPVRKPKVLTIICFRSSSCHETIYINAYTNILDII